MFRVEGTKKQLLPKKQLTDADLFLRSCDYGFYKLQKAAFYFFRHFHYFFMG
ncbi:hypothetical protein BB65665_13346 [Bacillus sp. 916]|nr:hypothetical protein BB65665_13346 [Bacillus sp. 916]